MRAGPDHSPLAAEAAGLLHPPQLRPAFTRQGLDQAQGQSSPQNQQRNNGTIHCKSETWMKVNLP